MSATALGNMNLLNGWRHFTRKLVPHMQSGLGAAHFGHLPGSPFTPAAVRTGAARAMSSVKDDDDADHSAASARTSRQKWTAEEDEKLCKGFSELGRSWSAISAYITGRSPRSCMARWEYCLAHRFQNNNNTSSSNSSSTTDTHGEVMPMTSQYRAWSKEEDTKLLKSINQHDFNWSLISEEMGRGLFACRYRWFAVLRPGLKRGAWSEKEINVLRLIVEQHQKNYLAEKKEAGVAVQPSEMWNEALKSIKWNAIAEELNRNEWIVRYQAMNSTNPAFRKGTWDPDETAQLEALIQTYGTRFSVISRMLKTRSPSQCFERWHRVSNPAINKGFWSSEEDASLKVAYDKYGPSWPLLANIVQNRTASQCRDRYLRLARSVTATADEVQ